MSVYGAATSGVDPQTGSYLSAEQRIAMFKGATGRSGYRGRSDGGGGNTKRTVNPQSAIVVVNKMSSSIQTLQTNFQETTGTVSNQVVENKSAIDGLYNLINAKRDQELKEEKKETENLRLTGEQALRNAREKLIEGLSTALAGLARAGQVAASAVIKPVEGLFQRLMKVLGMLAAAWAVENLPKIIDSLQEWDLSLEGIKDKFFDAALKTRGIWSVLDRVLQPIKNLISKIARKALSVGRYIFQKAISIGRKIFEKIGNFVGRIVRKVVGGVKNLVVNGFRSIRNAFRPPTPNPNAPRLPPGSVPDPSGGGATPKPKPKFNVLNPSTWFGTEEPPAKLPDPDAPPKAGAPGQSPKGSTQPEMKPDAKKGHGAFKKFIQPVLAKLPKSLAKRILSVTDWAFRKLPVIGGLVDFALNKMAGQGDAEAMMRAIGSSVLGAGGWWAGGKAGAAIGFAGGSLFAGVGALPGAAIGGIIGAILGSIGAGALGDQLGAWVYEGSTGNTRTENEVLGSDTVQPLADMISGAGTPPEAPGEAPDSSGSTPITSATIESPSGETLHSPDSEHVKVPIRDYSKIFSEGSSTVAGLDPSSVLAASDINFMELPPVMTKLKSDKPKTSSGDPGQTVPSFATSSKSVDYYRAFASKEYQLL